jgi:UDP-3-O-acyl N-acetylglucosamine deacetylase
MTRRTLAAAAHFAGHALFTETYATGRILPADPETGIAFIRNDTHTPIRIPATVASISTSPAHPAFASLSPRCTTLAHADTLLHTVEHVLSALVGLGITDAIIEIDSCELPIGDGSATMFTDAIRTAGIRDLHHPVQPIRLTRSLVVSDASGATITAYPSDTLSLEYRLDYPGTIIAAQSASWDGTPDSYATGVAPARTFSLQHEAEAMHALGLFRSFTPRDLLVIGSDGPIDNQFRFPDEPARHKLLDLIGDLALVGQPFVARIIAERSGHALNHRMATLIAQSAGLF